MEWVGVVGWLAGWRCGTELWAGVGCIRGGGGVGGGFGLGLGRGVELEGEGLKILRSWILVVESLS